MSFARLISLVIIATKLCFGILPNDLVFTPTAIFPTENQTEFGYQLSYYTVSGVTDHKGFYLIHSLSKNIKYGAEFYEGPEQEYIYQHLAFKIGSLFKNSNYEFNFSGGVNYLSSDPVLSVNQTIYDGYITQTWNPLESPFQTHATFARKIDDDTIVLLGAISYHQKWGTLQLEWDSNYLNLGSQVVINDRVIIRTGITKNILDESELIFKSTFGFIDLGSQKSAPLPKHDNALENNPKITTTNVTAGLEHLQNGIDFYYQGEYRKALKSYELARNFFPNSAIVYERLGSIYYKLGELENALMSWEKAQVIEPSDKLNKYITDLREKIKSL